MLMDADGYPDEQELKKIKEWEGPFLDLMEYIRPRWAYAQAGYWRAYHKDGGVTFRCSTAGWSGNEDIVGALQENYVFWGICWRGSRRGGHYEFSVPIPKR